MKRMSNLRKRLLREKYKNKRESQVKSLNPWIKYFVIPFVLMIFGFLISPYFLNKVEEEYLSKKPNQFLILNPNIGTEDTLLIIRQSINSENAAEIYTVELDSILFQPPIFRISDQAILSNFPNQNPENICWGLNIKDLIRDGEVIRKGKYLIRILDYDNDILGSQYLEFYSNWKSNSMPPKGEKTIQNMELSSPLLTLCGTVTKDGLPVQNAKVLPKGTEVKSDHIFTTNKNGSFCIQIFSKNGEKVKLEFYLGDSLVGSDILYCCTVERNNLVIL